jgi:hypothetical protein
METLHLLSALGVVNAAVGQNAVAIGDHKSHLRGFSPKIVAIHVAVLEGKQRI